MSNIEIIHVSSTVTKSENQPLVLVKYKNTEGTLSVSDARNRAIALIRATTIAEQEAKMIVHLSPVFQKKGFVSPTAKELEMHAGIVRLVRDCRPKQIHSDISPIFGYKTKLPLIDYLILNTKIQLQIPEALSHAKDLLLCAEGAQYDSLVYNFGDRLEIEREKIATILADFARQRKAFDLE